MREDLASLRGARNLYFIHGRNVNLVSTEVRAKNGDKYIRGGQSPTAVAGAHELIKAGIATLFSNIETLHYPRDPACCVPTRAGQPERAKSYKNKTFGRMA